MKELFVHRHILNANSMFIHLKINNFINKKEWISMRQYTLDSIDIKNDTFFFLMLILAHKFVLLIQLSNLASKFDISGMTRAGSKYLCFNRCAYECEITNHVQQFMPCRFIAIMKFFIVQYARRAENYRMIEAQFMHQFLDLIVREITINNDDRIIKISTFN